MTESGEGGADVPANDAATWTVRAWMQTEEVISLRGARSLSMRPPR